jgi:hypothetical protein
MFDATVTTIAVGLPVLTGVYWVCLILGGGLLIISAIGGGDSDGGVDVDVDADVSVDTDVDMGHAHATSLANWLSVHFAVFFMAMFGLVGVTLTHLTAQSTAVTLASALAGGIVVGQGAHQILRRLRRSSGDSTPKPEDYVNKLARVTIDVSGPKGGEVALRVGRAERFVRAVPRHSDQTFSSGALVGVVGYHDGVAEVVSREEYDFLKNKN